VLALGVNGIYHDGGGQWAHRIVAGMANHANAVLTPVSGAVEQYLAKVQMAAARSETQSCQLSTAVARIQASAARAHSGMARVEAMSAREEAQLARLEANRARIEAQMARAQFANMTLKPMEFGPPNIHVTCPRLRVVVPRLPVLKPISVHVETTGPGPV
jgi:hypothetical protein